MGSTRKFDRVTVLGAGAWGTALANAAARAGRKVTLWARDPAQVAAIAARGESPRLPGVPLEPGIRPQADLAAAVAADLILVVVPAQATRSLLQQVAGAAPAGVPVVYCSKGIEQGTGLFLHQVSESWLPANPCAILSGPSFAVDVSRGLPTAVTLASGEAELARAIAAALAGPALRLYHSTDVVGVEIGGAAKNVLAIACGIAAGRGLGASAAAALVARGFAELSRFGRAHGAKPETLMGLSGLGDLVLTCSSTQSRNFSYGQALGRGEPPNAASHGKLAEGAYTAQILVEKARSAGVEMPISEAVEAIVAGRITVDAAVGTLLARPSKAEGA